MEPLTAERVETAIFTAARRCKNQFASDVEQISFSLESYRQGLVSRQAMGFMVYEVQQDGLTMASLSRRVGNITDKEFAAFTNQFNAFKLQAVGSMEASPAHIPSAEAFISDDAMFTVSAARALVDRSVLLAPRAPGEFGERIDLSAFTATAPLKSGKDAMAFVRSSPADQAVPEAPSA